MGKHERGNYRGTSHAAQDAGRRHNAGSGKRSKQPLFILILLLVGIGVACGAAVASLDMSDGVDQGAEIDVIIPNGSGAAQIGQLLEDNRIIADSNEFVAEVDAEDASSKLQPGTYTFTGGSDMDVIVQKIVNGDTSGEMLTIPEGYTVKQIAKAVHKAIGISVDDFVAQANNAGAYTSDYDFLSNTYNGSLEGFLFPDTYAVSEGMTADDVIRMMLDNFKSKLESVNIKRAKKRGLSEYDVVVLASMVQLESSTDKDKAKIAAVFCNRMDADMNLGSDVTAYYAAGKDLTDTLTEDDIYSDDPYNTRNPSSRGLPPGPICNPGLSALKAAAKPSKTSALYFFYSESQDKVMFYNDLSSFNNGWALYGDGS